MWPSHMFDMSSFLTFIYVLNFLIAFTVLFLERKEPSKTLAWIMILFLLPGVGILFYAFFSQNIARQKIFRLSKFEEANISTSLYEQMTDIRNNTFPFAGPESKKWQDMIRLNQVYGSSYFTQDNHITILTDGKHKFSSLIEDIERAETSINVMYYILKPDSVGRALLDALVKKAAEGVEVRVLVDAMGSRRLSPRHFEKLTEAGGHYAFFFPPKFKYINMKLNYRNHRKLVVIDGRIGYMGGFNVGNEYVGKVKKFGNWRDTHLRITGGAVQDMDARFILDWRFASGENLVISHAFYPAPPETGHTGIQIVSCGPDTPQTEVKLAYLKMISSAKKNIYIQTPYFVPDDSILEALKMAALSGVDVRLMIPCKPDHIFVYWATYSYVGILLNAGARIYIYEDGFLHAKTITVDGEVTSVGSANFDIRSFYLNFEANAFIYDSAEAYKMEAIFEMDIARSHQLTRQEYRSRSLLIKFKESIARLLSDLL
ncbi:cardiolipin synthase [Bacilliculturomica massiliensis]|uniref:cardiolipin synthase n=1 Tax=Bacilliculturomica massiliensis TaxID=1917867 RepID=UPI001A91ECA2|nr:cardiolipin synthase [Bacilliculturomica massiliensis]